MANLLEAEGRSLRYNLLRTALLLGGMMAAVLLLLGGVGLLAYALWTALETQVGTVAAAGGLGISLLVIAGVLAWTILRIGR